MVGDVSQDVFNKIYQEIDKYASEYVEVREEAAANIGMMGNSSRESTVGGPSSPSNPSEAGMRGNRKLDGALDKNTPVKADSGS